VLQSATTTEFCVPQSAEVVLKVYNGISEEIETMYNRRAEGNRQYRFTFNASHFAAGLYYAELQYGTQVAVHKILLLK
jgi:hypothetical protein